MDPFFITYLIKYPPYFAVFEKYIDFYNHKLTGLPVYIEAIKEGFILVIKTPDYFYHIYQNRDENSWKVLKELSKDEEVEFIFDQIANIPFPENGFHITLQVPVSLSNEIFQHLCNYYKEYESVEDIQITPRLGSNQEIREIEMIFQNLAGTRFVVTDLFELFLRS